jgi:uncharacterized caspase-like protein
MIAEPDEEDPTAECWTRPTTGGGRHERHRQRIRQDRARCLTFVSSQRRETSEESAVWGHGALTKALIEGLAGKADLLRDGTITVSELDAFIANRMKALKSSAPRDEPPQHHPDFAFAVVK